MQVKQKKCLLFETLGKVSDLNITESSNHEMRLSGVFGVTGIKNQNNRVYDKKNYSDMVRSLQEVIATEGCPGELEHPNSMNINLENVSHKIESIQMNEDGTITGTILLLNTPKGQIAKAIVEGGLPLYISSRAQGTITNEGRVTLSNLKTYDLVGTPGFSQAKLTLKENQTLECLNESLENGNITYAIIDESDDEGDDLLGLDDSNKKSKDSEEKDSKDEKKDDKKSDDSKEEKKSDDKESDDKKEEKKPDDKKEEKEDTKNKDNNTSKITMEDIKKSIDALVDKVNSLEAQLHITNESLENEKKRNEHLVEAIDAWVNEEFAGKFKTEFLAEAKTMIEESKDESPEDNIDEKINDKINEAIVSLSEGIQNWITEEYSPEIQNWVCEEFAPEVQDWIAEEYSPEIQNWVCEEFAPEVQGWVCEEFAPEVQNWITEEYSQTVENWINEELTPNITEEITESMHNTSLEKIDSLLEAVDNANVTEKPLDKVLKESAIEEKFKGLYFVENMPAEYTARWNMLTEAKQNEIIRTSKMYDFTKEGVLESFWANVDFESKSAEEKMLNESESIKNNPIKQYHNNVFNQMMRLRH